MANLLAHGYQRLRYAALRGAYRAVRATLHSRALTALARLPHAHVDTFVPAEAWIFHDQSWSRVQSRFGDRLRVRRGLTVDADDVPQPAGERVRFGPPGSIAFDAPVRTDSWLYLHLDPALHPWRDYRWSFEVRRLTDFRELQFALRYRDFYNRYRYRFEDDCLHFDVVHRGVFYNSLTRVACRLEPHTWHRVELDVVGRALRCRVNDRTLSVDWDPFGLFAEGPVAVILWEDDGQTPLRAEIRDMKVRALEP